MAWSWSHTAEAYATARENLEELPRDTLEEICDEWALHDADEGHPADEEVDIPNLPDDVLVDYIWERAEEQALCDNGGWAAWVCPYGCHTVPFSRGNPDEELKLNLGLAAIRPGSVLLVQRLSIYYHSDGSGGRARISKKKVASVETIKVLGDNRLSLIVYLEGKDTPLRATGDEERGYYLTSVTQPLRYTILEVDGKAPEDYVREEPTENPSGSRSRIDAKGALQDLYDWAMRAPRGGNPYMVEEVRNALRALSGTSRSVPFPDLPARRPRAKVEGALYDLTHWALHGERYGLPENKPEVKAAAAVLGGTASQNPSSPTASEKSITRASLERTISSAPDPRARRLPGGWRGQRADRFDAAHEARVRAGVRWKTYLLGVMRDRGVDHLTVVPGMCSTMRGAVQSPREDNQPKLGPLKFAHPCHLYYDESALVAVRVQSRLHTPQRNKYDGTLELGPEV